MNTPRYTPLLNYYFLFAKEETMESTTSSTDDVLMNVFVFSKSWSKKKEKQNRIWLYPPEIQKLKSYPVKSQQHSPVCSISLQREKKKLTRVN